MYSFLQYCVIIFVNKENKTTIMDHGYNPKMHFFRVFTVVILRFLVPALTLRGIHLTQSKINMKYCC